jgi:hypothetical protein
MCPCQALHCTALHCTALHCTLQVDTWRAPGEVSSGQRCRAGKACRRRGVCCAPCHPCPAAHDRGSPAGTPASQPHMAPHPAVGVSACMQQAALASCQALPVCFSCPPPPWFSTHLASPHCLQSLPPSLNPPLQPLSPPITPAPSSPTRPTPPCEVWPCPPPAAPRCRPQTAAACPPCGRHGADREHMGRVCVGSVLGPPVQAANLPRLHTPPLLQAPLPARRQALPEHRTCSSTAAPLRGAHQSGAEGSPPFHTPHSAQLSTHLHLNRPARLMILGTS